MNNQNFHPVQVEPPLAHALHHWDPKTGILWYEYNGKNILQLQFPDGEDPGFRHGSDGSMQSMSYVQQLYFEVKRRLTVQVKFTLSADSHSMKPKRAKENEAILGACGQDCIATVNGLYDPCWDLLLDWHGAEWKWLKCEQVGDERIFLAEFYLTPCPMYLNLRMQYYRKHLGYEYHRPWEHRPNPKPVAGWCSWEAYRRDISQEKIERMAMFLADALKDRGLEYLQVDDGYQEMPLPADGAGNMADGWMQCKSDRFPQGHEGIVQAIQGSGLKPGIWTNANITNERFAEQHPEDVIFFEGHPLKGEWIDFLYRCTPENLYRQVVPIFERLRQAGYQYVKIDAIRHLLFDGLHECVRLGLFDNDEAQRRFRAYMEATRQGLGENIYYLASWGEMTEVVGLADACRISMDANPTWAGVHMQLFESARWFRTQTPWAKSILSLISLSGQLYMLSDPPEVYTPEKLAVIEKTLPPLATVTAETGPLPLEYPAYTWTKLHGFAVQSKETPVEAGMVSMEEAKAMAGQYEGIDAAHPFSSLWAFHLGHANHNWCVMLRVATMPLQETGLRLGSLGLDEENTYLAFDFWSETYLGEVRGELCVPALELGCCQVVRFTPKEDVPQFLADNRHVSMGAVGMLQSGFEGNTLSLQLAGQVGEKRLCWFHIPQTHTLETVSQNAEVVSQSADGLLKLCVAFTTEEETVCLAFSESDEP